MGLPIFIRLHPAPRFDLSIYTTYVFDTDRDAGRQLHVFSMRVSGSTPHVSDVMLRLACNLIVTPAPISRTSEEERPAGGARATESQLRWRGSCRRLHRSGRSCPRPHTRFSPTPQNKKHTNPSPPPSPFCTAVLSPFWTADLHGVRSTSRQRTGSWSKRQAVRPVSEYKNRIRTSNLPTT